MCILDLSRMYKMVLCGRTIACQRYTYWKLVILLQIVKYQGILQEFPSHWSFAYFWETTPNYLSIATRNACKQPPGLLWLLSKKREKVNSSINSTADVECPKQLRLWSVPGQMVCMTKALYGLHPIWVTFPSISTRKQDYLEHSELFGAA